MKSSNSNTNHIFSIITGVLTFVLIVAWLVLLIGDDEFFHYKREGRITSVEAIDTIYSESDTTKISTIKYKYYYTDKNNEEIVQTTRDMYMNSKYYVEKYNNKYFYSYRTWTNHFIYLVLAIFCGILHLASVKSENSD